MSDVIPPMVSTTPPPLGDDEDDDEDFTPTHFNYQNDADSDSPEPKEASEWPPPMEEEKPAACLVNGVHHETMDDELEEELKRSSDPPAVLDNTSQDSVVSTNTDSGLCSASEEVSPLPPPTSPLPPLTSPLPLPTSPVPLDQTSDEVPSDVEVPAHGDKLNNCDEFSQFQNLPPNGINKDLCAFSSPSKLSNSDVSKPLEIFSQSPLKSNEGVNLSSLALEDLDSRSSDKTNGGMLDEPVESPSNADPSPHASPPPSESTLDTTSSVPNNHPVPQLNCDPTFEFGDFENAFEPPPMKDKDTTETDSEDDFADFQSGQGFKSKEKRDFKSGHNDISDFKSGDNDFDEFQNGNDSTGDDYLKCKINEFSEIKSGNGDLKHGNNDFNDFQSEDIEFSEFKTENDKLKTVTDDFQIENNDFDDFKSGNEFSDFQSVSESAFDDFADFSSAPPASSDQDWSAFPEPSKPQVSNNNSDDDFDDFESAVPTDDLPSQSCDVADVFSKLFSSTSPEITLPEVPPETLTSWLSTGKIWSKVHQVQTSPALDFQWAASSSSTWLLRALGIDSRNILFGQKWNSNMPRFAANLGSSPLEPMKAASGSSSTSTEEMVPAAQFDWTGSGLVNPLDSVRKRNPEQERQRQLHAVISSLPNLSFMRSSHLVTKKSS